MAGQQEDRLRGKNGQQPEKSAGGEGKIDSLPENGAYFLRVAPAGILGDEDTGIATYPAEKGQKKIGGNARRKSCGNGVD